MQKYLVQHMGTTEKHMMEPLKGPRWLWVLVGEHCFQMANARKPFLFLHRQSGDAGHASALVMPITLLLLESHRCLRPPPSSLRLHIKRNVGKQEAKL